jgi:hypothetical protein
MPCGTWPGAEDMVFKPFHDSQKSKWLDSETLEVNLEIVINNVLKKK